MDRLQSVLLTLAVAFTTITCFVAARTFFCNCTCIIFIFKSRFIYFIFLVVIICVSIYYLLDLPALQPYKDWMLSFFSLSEDASGSYLIEKMYFWPGDSIFLFGLGTVNDGTFTYTDGGYMQDILFGGVFFLAMKLLFLAVLFLVFSRSILFLLLLFHSLYLLFISKAYFFIIMHKVWLLFVFYSFIY